MRAEHLDATGLTCARSRCRTASLQAYSSPVTKLVGVGEGGVVLLRTRRSNSAEWVASNI